MTAAFDLLGGAERRKTRARGFAPWNPQAPAQTLLVQVQAVLAEYAAYLPITCRQVFYRLVGAHQFDKTERAYERLCETLNRARRAGLIPMDAIRDDGGHRIVPPAWEGSDDFLSAVRAQAERLGTKVPSEELQQIAADAQARPMRFRAETIASKLMVTYAERTALKITTMGCIDMSREERLRRSKDRRRLKQQSRRREQGSMNRLDYLATSKSRLKPWVAEGISRATWYRRQSAAMIVRQVCDTHSGSICLHGPVSQSAPL